MPPRIGLPVKFFFLTPFPERKLRREDLQFIFDRFFMRVFPRFELSFELIGVS